MVDPIRKKSVDTMTYEILQFEKLHDLASLRIVVNRCIKDYGKDAKIRFYAGHSHVSFLVTPRSNLIITELMLFRFKNMLKLNQHLIYLGFYKDEIEIIMGIRKRMAADSSGRIRRGKDVELFLLINRLALERKKGKK